MLSKISEVGFYQPIIDRTETLMTGLKERASAKNIPLTTNQAGSMFGFFFSEEPAITRFEQVIKCDINRFQHFFHGMLENGVYLAPSAYETGFMSAAHSDTEIQATLDAAEKVFKQL